MNRITTILATIAVIVMLSSVKAEEGFIQHTITTQFDGGFSIIAADLDSDGDNDIIATAINDNTIKWWENKPDHSLQEHILDSTFLGAHTVFAVDLDQDGDMDILGSAFQGNEIAWFENDGNQNFTKITIRADYNGARDVIACDLDLDGDWDVVGCCSGGHHLTWWENDGNQVFTEHPIAYWLPFPISVYACDLDGDQDIDLVLADHDNGLTWWENLGNQRFTYHVISSAFDGAWDVCAADIDGDGDLDVAAASMYEQSLSWWENQGHMTFSQHILYSTFNGFGRSVYIADLDGDNDLDIIGGLEYGLHIPWYENDGTDWFVEHGISNSLHDAFSVYVADIDGDGKKDVLSTGYEYEGVAWFENVLGVSVSIVPRTPSPIIPIEGDTLDFTITARNYSDTATVAHIWCDVVFPDSTVHGPLLQIFGCNLASDSIKTWMKSQIVPARAPSGTYHYRVFIGDNFGNVWDGSDFLFTKLGAGTSSDGLADWLNQDETPNGQIASTQALTAVILKVCPNPFNPSTTIRFTLPEAAKVTLEVFDIGGRCVSGSGTTPTPFGIGSHEITFDGSNLPSGVYLYRLNAGNATITGKMVLLK